MFFVPQLLKKGDIHVDTALVIMLCSLLSQRCLWVTLVAHPSLTSPFQYEFLPSLLRLIVMNAFILSAIDYAASVKIRVSLFYLCHIFSQLLPFSCQCNCRWYPVSGCQGVGDILAEAIARSLTYLARKSTINWEEGTQAKALQKRCALRGIAFIAPGSYCGTQVPQLFILKLSS